MPPSTALTKPWFEITVPSAAFRIDAHIERDRRDVVRRADRVARITPGVGFSGA